MVPNDPDYAPKRKKSKRRKRRRRKILRITLLAITLAALVAAGIFLALWLLGDRRAGSGSGDGRAIQAFVTADGSEAFLPLPGGKVIHLTDGEIASAFITGDGQHVIVHLKDGVIYVADPNLKNKWIVTEDGSRLSYDFIHNEGFLFEAAARDFKGTKSFHRALFADKSVTEVPLSIGSSLSSSTLKASLAMGTGGEAGTYFAVGGVLANVLNEKNPDLMSVIAVPTGGSADNLWNMANGVYQLATVQSDVMTYAYNGIRTFERIGAVHDVCVLAGLYAETVQIVTTDPSIKTVADLRGKIVCVGDQDSGTYFNAKDVFDAYGMDIEKDITPIFQSFGASTESLKDGKIDAAFLTAGAPTTSVVDLGTARPVYLVSIDDEHMAKLLETCPFYARYTIDKDVYKTPEDCRTVTVKATLVADASVPDDVAYAIVKTIFEYRDEIAAAHVKGAQLDLAFATDGMAIPFHPGAARYFAEKGITVDISGELTDIYPEYTIAPHTTTIFFEDFTSRSVCILPSGEDERVRIGTRKDDYTEVYPCLVSDDGLVALWTTCGSGDAVYTLFEDGEKKTIPGSDELTLDGVFSADQRMLLFTNGSDLWIKERGKDLSAVHIPGHVLSPYWTNAGRLESTPCAKIKTIYVTTRDPNGYYGLYAVSRDGEKERLLYKAKSISVTAGRVVYTDENEDLYTATIAGNQLGEKKRIARSAFCAFLSENGKYVYYLTNVSDSFGTLYGYRIGDKAPKKIAPDIHVEWPSSIKCISEDGSTILFARGLEDFDPTAPDESLSDARLMLWRYGDKEPVKVASGAMPLEASMRSGLIFAYYPDEDFSETPCIRVGVLAEPKGFYYYRWNGAAYDLMWFNGKDSEKISSSRR